MSVSFLFALISSKAFSPHFAAGSESGINAVLLLKATSFVTAVEIKHGNFAACASINETGSPS